MSEQTAAQDQEQKRQEVIAAIAALIIVGGVGSLSGSAATALATQISKLMLIPLPLALAIVTLAMSQPVHVPAPEPSRDGALAATQDDEYLFRAAYIEAAIRRTEQAVRAGYTPEEAARAERRNFLLHVQSQRIRSSAAVAVDRMARQLGTPELGWYTVLDARTSPECRAANGTNFDVGVRPVIGYPGAVHPSCRCKPGKPHAGGQPTDSAFVRRASREG